MSSAIVLVIACEPASPEAEAELVLVLDDDVCASGDACALDLGVQHQTTRHAFAFVNMGEAPAVIDSVSVDDDAGVFRVMGSTPETVAHGELLEVELDVTPSSTEPDTGTLSVRWGPPRSTTSLQLTVVGPPQPIARIEGECGFGEVVVGDESAACAINIHNDGAADLVVTDLAMDDAGGVFRPASSTIVPFSVPPAAIATIALTATPDEIGGIDGNLAVVMSDGGIYSMTLSVIGVDP